MKNIQERKLLLNRLLIIIMVCMLALMMAACGGNQAEVVAPGAADSSTELSETMDNTQINGESQGTAENQDGEVNRNPDKNQDIEESSATKDGQEANNTQRDGLIKIETKYGTLLFPEKYSEYLKQKEVAESAVTTEIFSMVYDDMETELFRVYFGGEQIGDAIGALTTDSGEILIYISVCEYDEYYFDEESYEIYSVLMEGLDTVISSIWNHPQFTDLKKVEIKEEERELSYWNFSLPENMELEETEESGYYLARFYGTVNNQKYELYSLAVGEPTLETVLGVYEVDGAPVLISVESYDLPNMENWEERHMGQIYTMMGSINTVIQTVMSSEGFSEEIPG